MGRKNHTLGEVQRQDLTRMITSALREETRVLFAFLYGSFLDGASFRDIDLGVFIQHTPAIDFWEYECMLSQKIEETLNHRFPVETKIINYAPFSFTYHVIRGRLLFVCDEDVLANFMVSVARNYLDMAPLRRKYILEAMA